MQQDKVLHGFYLNEMGGDGEASILRFPVLPDHIINIVPRTPSGSTITYRLLVSGKPDTCDVVESKKEIEKLKRRCKTLDDQASTANAKGEVPHVPGMRGTRVPITRQPHSRG